MVAVRGSQIAGCTVADLGWKPRVRVSMSRMEKMILCEIYVRVKGKRLLMTCTQSWLLIANQVRVTDIFYRYD